MVYLKLQGRLGNQMFQYAFARWLQEITKIDKLIINSDRVKKRAKNDKDGWDNDLKYFQIVEYKDVDSKNPLYFYFLIKLKIVRWLILKGREKGYDLQNWAVKRGVIYCYNPVETSFCLNKKVKNYIIDGLFEYSSIAEKIRADLLKEFQAKDERNNKNNMLYEAIKNSNSICVTIRKFDLENKDFSHYYQVCNLEFYYHGIEKLKEIIDNVKIFVFSDNIEWCKKHFSYENNKNVFFESGNDTVDEKLRLMSACKYFVISNSTFSWWAQFLSENKEKIVCAPEWWHRDQKTIDIGINDSRWILIENRYDR